MINLSPSTTEDQSQILEWTQADPYHYHQIDYSGPGWWLTGAEKSLLAFCLMDQKGPVAYVRLDEEDELVRIHTQFAPESIVSKRRLVVGMIACMKKLIELYKTEGKKGMIFNSVNPSLAAFMGNHLDFKLVGNDDYLLNFEGQ